MIYASTFLSHSSVDKELVEAVAHALGRRGVLGWLDINELKPGASLRDGLQEAIERQVTTTVFLSMKAVQSDWVQDELAIAFDTHDAAGVGGNIIPVFLGDPMTLLAAHPRLNSRWLHADGKRVAVSYVDAQGATDRPELAATVATRLANRIYQALELKKRREVILYVDQRGEGRRHSEPDDVPPRIQALGAPALVFRPDLNDRQQYEIQYGDDLQAWLSDMRSALGDALGNLRGPEPKQIHILGNAQLGIPFWLGQYFNRSTSTHLFGYNRDGSVFNNASSSRHTPVEGGNADCTSAHERIQPLQPGDRSDSVALILTACRYVQPALDYLDAQSDTAPRVWVEHGHFPIQGNDQVLSYIADIVALLTQLNRDHGVSHVKLFCGLPFNIVPLLAANLLHVVHKMTFMEYRRDLQGQAVSAGAMYVPLEL